MNVLGACIDQHYYWELYWEEIKWRPAISAELRESPSSPERMDESTMRGRIMRNLPQRTKRKFEIF
jgi:hypothetical protein